MQKIMEIVDFADQGEETQHARAIEHLCLEFPEYREIVPCLYEGRLLELMPEAKIRQYVSIFITRELRETLSPLKHALNS
jgi:hypothetical protein